VVSMVRAVFVPARNFAVDIVRWSGSESLALRVNLGGEQLVIGPPDGEDGAAVMAAFLAVLAETCGLLEAELAPSSGRHSHRWPGGAAVDRGEGLGESGVGRLPG